MLLQVLGGAAVLVAAIVLQLAPRRRTVPEPDVAPLV
jgi:hypothetical protein